MDMYSFSLALGAAGLGVMGLSGFAHTLGGHHGAGQDGGAHAGHHLGAVRGAHGARGVRAGRAGHSGHGLRGGPSRALWALLSPRPLFSILVGFGATGMALRGVAHGAPLLALAAAGGLALELLVLAPLWNLLFRFESAPALTLESSIGDAARAATTFDANGQGVVALELDGQMVQLLGTLHRDDRMAGLRVRAGDALTIDDVDPERNRCTVRLGGA